MPITFEQPQPFSPSIAEAYGAAVQGQQGQGQLNDMAARTAALLAAGGNRGAGDALANANADRLQQAANVDAQVRGREADRFQQNQQFYGQIAQQENQQTFQANQEAARITQRFNMQADLQQQELSQAEYMRMERLKSALATIAQKKEEGFLSEDEANALYLQAKTGLDPLRNRFEMQQAKIKEMQFKDEMEFRQRNIALEHADMATRIAMFDKMLVHRPDPVTGQLTSYQYDRMKGIWIPLENPKGTKSGPEGQSAVDQVKHETQMLKMAMDQAKVRMKAERADVMEKDAMGQPNQEYHRLLGEMTGRIYDGLLRQYQQTRVQEQQPTAAAPGGSTGYQGGQAPEALQPRPVNYDPAKPQQMPPEVRQNIERFDVVKQRIRNYFTDPAKRDEYLRTADKAQEYLAQYGSPANMPDDVRDHYARIIDAMVFLSGDYNAQTDDNGKVKVPGVMDKPKATKTGDKLGG